jgi:hypothetical protein
MINPQTLRNAMNPRIRNMKKTTLRYILVKLLYMSGEKY